MSGHHGRPETAHALKGRYDKRQTSFCVLPIYLPMTHSQQFLSRLDDLAVLRIEGADAVQFLQAQLSNDISSLGATDARLAAYCNPKGRMLGSLIIFREQADTAESLMALVKADIVEPLLKRLRMFVLRSKVTIDVAPYSVWGLAGRDASGDSGTPHTPWAVHRDESGVRIDAPTSVSGGPRQWIVLPAENRPRQLAELGDLPLAGREAWYAQDIEAGLGWVEQANVELFIPQSLNYDLNGGVSFTKGCYPGQEVVARAHFRGVVKRRGLPAHCVAPAELHLAAGDDIHDANNPRSPAGRIINAARTAHHTDESAAQVAWHAFVELNVGDLEQADLRAGSPEGPQLRILPLPYSLEIKD